MDCDSEGRKVIVCDNGTGVSENGVVIKYHLKILVYQMWLLYIEFS